MINKWTPAPRRVRLYQNGHGAYLFDRIVRSHAHPEAHWGPGIEDRKIIRPPRVERTHAQAVAMIRRANAQRLGYDMFH